MKFFHIDSIAGRTMIVLLIGLTLSHIASTALFSTDRHDAVIAASERLCADRIALLAYHLDGATSDDRARLVAMQESPILKVALATEPSVGANHHDEHELSAVGDAFRSYFGVVGDPRLHVIHRLASNQPYTFWENVREGFPKDQAMEVSFRLSDGSWANFDIAMARAATLYSPHLVTSTLIMMLAIVVLGFWATGWVARPLAAFAKAADRLGRDVTAPPLAKAGAREVRNAVAAFNAMQERIRRFVEDRTRMIAAISHDLRSPITRLRLRTEMLPESEPRVRMLADLDEMEAMVASTLDFSRIDSSDEQTEAIDLAAMLETVCDNASDIGLPATYIWERRIICSCRPMSLKRALTNLIENGARYGAHATVSAITQDYSLQVVIQDEGPGIPETEMEKIFSPFYRLENSRNRKTGGIGLGMTVARTIIHGHGGNIWLENRSEGGLRVIVTLPQEGKV